VVNALLHLQRGKKEIMYQKRRRWSMRRKNEV